MWSDINPLILYKPQLLLIKAKRLITVSFFLLLFFSCNKENDFDVSYGSLYYKSEAQKVPVVHYYNQNGEINNTSIPSFWIQDDTAYSTYLLGLQLQPGRFDTIKFLSQQEAVIKIYSTETKYTTANDGGNMILTSKDNISGYSSGDEYTKSPPYYSVKYKTEVASEWIRSSVRGDYIFGYLGKSKAVVDKSGDKLVLPFLFIRQRRGGFIRGAYMENNLLQPDFYKNIMAGDTIVIMEAKVFYSKK